MIIAPPLVLNYFETAKKAHSESLVANHTHTQICSISNSSVIRELLPVNGWEFGFIVYASCYKPPQSAP